jgi:predicted DsbA family dithiol-disulfide isomerase
MRVEVWADVICPWCGLGAHRLEAALERFPHRGEVQVTHRSFQLDPGAPAGSSEPVRAMLRKKGLEDAQIEAMTQRVEGLAQAEGLRPYHVLDNRVGSTALTHELLAYAADQGKQAEAWHRLFTAYFGEARPIFSVEDLVTLASEIGLDPEDAREALLSRRYEARVAAEGREAAELGATGVPFFVIDRRYGVAGAQPVDTLVAALQQAWDERLVPDRQGQSGTSHS